MPQNLCRETKVTLKLFPSEAETVKLLASLHELAVPDHIEEVEIILASGHVTRFAVTYLKALAAIAAAQASDFPAAPQSSTES
jgi:hypothetical protein